MRQEFFSNSGKITRKFLKKDSDKESIKTKVKD